MNVEPNISGLSTLKSFWAKQAETDCFKQQDGLYDLTVC